jgi:hypothetical protein
MHSRSVHHSYLVIVGLCFASYQAHGISYNSTNCVKAFGKQVYGNCEVTAVVGSGVRVIQRFDLEEFSNVVAHGNIVVQIEQADVHDVVVEAEDNIVPYVSVEVRNKTLYIGLKENSVLEFETPIRCLVRMTWIDKLESHDSVSMEFDAISSNNFRVDSYANARLRGTVYSNKAKVFANDNSVVELQGESQDFKARTNGFSKVETGKFMCEKCQSQSKGASAVDVICKNHLKASASGLSRIKADIQNGEVNVTGEGMAIISVFGKADSATVNVAGLSSYEGLHLLARACKVTAHGKSNADLNCRDELKAYANGLSAIQYVGNPQKLKEKTSGFAKIQKIVRD